MVILRRTFQALVLCALVLAPSVARADTFLSPFVGNLFGKDAVDPSFAWGGSLSSFGDGLLGFELDFTHAPNFFTPSADFVLIGTNNLTTVVVNLVASVPAGSAVIPYISAGGGLISSHVTDFGNFSRNDFGIDIGGGLVVMLSDRLGIRGDLRYFRSLSDENDGFFDFSLGKFDVWRATIGLSLRL